MIISWKKIYLLALFGLFFSSSQFVFAGINDRIKGFAWSDRVGWISFNNCDVNSICGENDYGVNLDRDDKLIGYAWNDVLGWIEFGNTSSDSIGNISPDNEEAFIDFSSLQQPLTGFAKIRSSGSNSEWNGEISFGDNSGNDYNVSVGSNYAFEGWAWNDLAGWIKLNPMISETSTSVGGVYIEPFEISFTVNTGGVNDKILPYISSVDGEVYPFDRGSVAPGEVTFTWLTSGTSTEDITCMGKEGLGDWRGSKNNGFGTTGIAKTISNISTDTTFILSCTDSSGNTIERSITVYVKSLPPTVSFTADNYDIERGTSTRLNWDVERISSCSWSTYFNGNAPFSSDGEGSRSTGNLINIENPFSIICTPSITDDYPESIVKSLTVYVEKLIANFMIPNIVPVGEKIRISWDVENVNSCTVTDNSINNRDTMVPDLNNPDDVDNGHLYGFAQMVKEINSSSLEDNWESVIQTEPGKIYSLDVVCTGGAQYENGVSRGTQMETIEVRIKVGGFPSYLET